MKMLIIVLFLFFSTNNLFAQSNKYQVSLNVNYSKMDLFTGCSFISIKNKIDNEFSRYTGTIRTFFQGAFFPMIQYSLNYKLINKSSFSFSPLLSMNLAMINLKTTKTNIHLYPEILMGYKISYGKKIGIIHKSSIGLLSEFFQSQLNKTKWASTFSYHFNIGVYYAIN